MAGRVISSAARETEDAVNALAARDGAATAAGLERMPLEAADDLRILLSMLMVFGLTGHVVER